MINFISILILIVVEAFVFMSVLVYYKEKLNKKDEEITERDRELGKRTSIIKEKNLTIRLQDTMIKELEDENKRIKREYNKGLRKNS